ncbi:hypothetical protein D3C71_1987870 [compost metagenome]
MHQIVPLLPRFTARRKLTDQPGYIWRLVSHHDVQILAETAPRTGQVPHLLHLHTQPAAEMVELQTPHHHDKLVFLELVAVGVEEALVGRRLDHG